MENPVTTAKPRLLDEVRAVYRMRHLSLRTEPNVCAVDSPGDINQ